MAMHHKIKLSCVLSKCYYRSYRFIQVLIGWVIRSFSLANYFDLYAHAEFFLRYLSKLVCYTTDGIS